MELMRCLTQMSSVQMFLTRDWYLFLHTPNKSHDTLIITSESYIMVSLQYRILHLQGTSRQSPPVAAAQVFAPVATQPRPRSSFVAVVVGVSSAPSSSVGRHSAVPATWARTSSFVESGRS
jgi:hypothetical protein